MSVPQAISPTPVVEVSRPRRPEVLAPAGDATALAAALNAGADAVYFGLDDGFNARARAKNFALAELRETVQRVHRAGARAYVTLNTLVFEAELASVARVIAGIAEAGVDAIIVQDPAVALLAGRIAPTLEVHASTQMTISCADGAKFAAALGVTRVVVPRELSVKEIRTFASATPLELEVFIHGALCVSWSGQCLSSEAWGGRSANRGQCAQSCRMPYTLVVDGERRELPDVEYLLSPKDLAGMRAVPELMAIGVHGLKIEGRQKGPQYVATATRGYRRYVDAVLNGKAYDTDTLLELSRDMRDMTLSYSRGFSDGFLAGSDHQTLVEGRFPKHRGALLGRVLRVEPRAVLVAFDPAGRPWTGALATDGERRAPEGSVSSPLAADATARGPESAPVELRPGMGVVFDAGDPEDKHEPGGPVFAVDRERAGLRLKFGEPGPDLRRVRVGHRVWVTSDPLLARATDLLVKSEPALGRIALRLTVSGRAGTPLHVAGATDREHAHVESAQALTTARGDGLSSELLREKLGAFGGTPFHLATLDVTGLAPSLHLPVSELKQLRRALVAALVAQVDARTHAAAPWDRALADLRTELQGEPPLTAAAATPRLVVLCREFEQLEAAISAGVEEVELDWMEIGGVGRALERARDAGLVVTLAGLRTQKPGEEAFLAALHRLEPDGILVRNWSALVRLRELRGASPRPLLHGDFSLNVTNSITARYLLGQGLATLTAAYDLDERQLFALLDEIPANRCAIAVHHQIPTFHTEHCVYSHLLSHGRDYRTCGRPCERHRIALVDHQQRAHPVIVDAGCRNTVFNAETQTAARLVPQLRARGLTRLRVELLREDHAASRRIVETWQELLRDEVDARELTRRLSAIEQFGVAKGGMQLVVDRGE
ncbi:MAG: DUF3656 domain-containing protein [Planctomycetota bacterium]